MKIVMKWLLVLAVVSGCFVGGVSAAEASALDYLQNDAPAITASFIKPKEKDDKNNKSEAENEFKVTMSIHCGDRVVLADTIVTAKEGQTVFDVLKSVTQVNKIAMDSKGKGKLVYIKGIDNVYEFDKGPESGWIYTVNGVKGKVSCGAKKVSKGDKIKWMYVETLEQALS